MNIFETCKKTLLEQNFSLIKVNFGRFFHGQNFAQIIGQFFSRKNFAIKNRPNGEILPNLVTLIISNLVCLSLSVTSTLALYFKAKLWPVP